MDNISAAKTVKGRKRNKAIIEAATDTFIQYGFDSTTLDMIIEQAGGSRSTLYKNFGDKEGLFAAVIENMIDDIFTEDYEDDLENPTIESILSYYGSRFLHSVIKPRSVGLYRLILGEYNRFPAISQSFFEKGPEKSYTLLTHKLLSLDEVTLDEPLLTQISARFLEMLKTDLFMKTFCVADFHPNEDFIETQLQLSVDIIASYIRKKC